MRAALPLIGLAVGCGGDAAVAKHAPAERVAAPATLDAKLAANAACEGCHAEQAAEWRRSLHAEAWSDPVFLAAYAIEPLPFCRACHAPEAPIDEPSSPARHLGVACITCHVPSAPAEGAEHVRFAPRAGDPDGCASCHQFEFPEPQAAAMQSTVSEHAASKHSGRSCVDCHMPAVRGSSRRSHAFRVHGDAAMLRSAISASAERSTPRAVTVSLAVTGAGHAVPTGDMFRQLEVRAVAGDGVAGDGVAGDAVPVLRAEPVVLSREFVFAPGAHGPRRLQVADRRVPANGEPRQARLVFAQPIDELPVRWQVVYHRMGPREAELFGVDRAAEAIVIAEGVIPVDSARSPHRRTD